jgi:hypothetical protein
LYHSSFSSSVSVVEVYQRSNTRSQIPYWLPGFSSCRCQVSVLLVWSVLLSPTILCPSSRERGRPGLTLHAHESPIYTGNPLSYTRVSDGVEHVRNHIGPLSIVLPQVIWNRLSTTSICFALGRCESPGGYLPRAKTASSGDRGRERIGQVTGGRCVAIVFGSGDR